MTETNSLFEFQKAFEGYRTTAYYDSVGVLTIGIGHSEKRFPKPHLGEVWTDEQILEVWTDDVEDFFFNLGEWKMKLSEDQKAVVTDMAYQFGAAAINKSTLAQLVQKGQFEDAQREILRWVNAGGRPVLGIIKRAFARFYLWDSNNRWRDVANCGATSKNWQPLNDCIQDLGYIVLKQNGRFAIQKTFE